MKKSKFTEEQITYALRQVESGTPPADVCRQLGVSEATFYIWKKKYAHLGVSELRKLRSDVPRDLETIVTKAIDRDPARRYASAAELGADLERFLADESIAARRPKACGPR